MRYKASGAAVLYIGTFVALGYLVWGPALAIGIGAAKLSRRRRLGVRSS